MRFEFATARRILFGRGLIQEAGELAGRLGKNALVVTGQGGADPRVLLERLEKSAVRTHLFSVTGEPTVDLVREGVAQALEAGCDLVIGFGGGSSLDTAKAVAALLANPGDLFDYLEVIGQGKTLQQDPLPWVAIPTTAGTGSEVTRNAVLYSPDHQVKVSLRSPAMLARLAIIDPELTFSLPQAITASTGMDALAQVIEPFVSLRANPLTDGHCREGMRRAAWALRGAYQDGADGEAREAMCVVSLMGGLALANAGLGAVHGFAAPIGGMFSAPHGAVCASLLAPVMEVNLQALRERATAPGVLERYREAAQILTCNPAASAEDGAAWLDDLRKDLNIPPLSSYGITESDIPELVEKGRQASSMQANPIRLTDEELRKILQMAL